MTEKTEAPKGRDSEGNCPALNCTHCYLNKPDDKTCPFSPKREPLP
jgi:hypothetical protein